MAVGNLTSKASQEFGTAVIVRIFRPDYVNVKTMDLVSGYTQKGMMKNLKPKLRVEEVLEVYVKIIYGKNFVSPPDDKYRYLEQKAKQYGIKQYVAIPIRHPDNSSIIVGYVASASYRGMKVLNKNDILKLENYYSTRLSEVLI